jgi:hypothetical protein
MTENKVARKQRLSDAKRSPEAGARVSTRASAFRQPAECGFSRDEWFELQNSFSFFG